MKGKNKPVRRKRKPEPDFTAPEAVGPSWDVQRLEISTDGGAKVAVDADICGDVAVHPAIVGRDTGKWVVTHVHTGRAVCVVSTRDDARLVATACHEHLSDVFAVKSLARVVSVTPRWANDWLSACRLSGAYEPVENYRK